MNLNRLEFAKIFYNSINKSFKNEKNFYDFSNIYDYYDGTIFVDEVHTGDIGNEIFAQKLMKIK